MNGYMEVPEARLSCGERAIDVGIAAADQAYLNHIIREHPEWRMVIEIGTSWGVTALLLGLTMRCRGGTVLTIDNGDCRRSSVRQAWLENMIYIQDDELPNGAAHPALAGAIVAESCLVICDGGDKIAEATQYAPLLQPGSAFVVHDWEPDAPMKAVCLEKIQPIIADGNWNPLCDEEAVRWNSYFRGWLRR